MSFEHLNKRSVTKENLAGWLETVCYILDSFSVPLLKKAARTIDRRTERIDELHKEKIDDQKTIIQQQQEVIKKNSDELNDVKVTVRTEMNNYSSVLKNNCFTAQTRKTIEAAVKSISEQEDRSKNGLIYEME